jgi:hypothetical protein
MPEAARLERRRINENLIGLRPCPPTAPFQSLALLLMIATGAVLAASALVFAQDKSHVGHAHGRGDDGVVSTMPGQDAFGAIQEIVRLLEADPDTDWSKIDLVALREYLIDMSEVTLPPPAAIDARPT